MITAAHSRRAPAGASYRATFISGALATVTGSATAGTASSALFGFQWVSSGIPATATYKGTGFSTELIPKVCMITQVEVNLVMTTSFATTQDCALGLYFVNGYTALGTGGTLATFTVNCNSLDTNFGVSNFATTTAFPNGNGGIQIATTTNLGTLTGTVGIYPMRVFSGINNTVGAGFQSIWQLEFGNDPNTQALFLRNQQGFTIQPLTAWTAGGIATLYVGIEWIEMSSQWT